MHFLIQTLMIQVLLLLSQIQYINISMMNKPTLLLNLFLRWSHCHSLTSLSILHLQIFVCVVPCARTI